ncbi:exonuclease SbcCD subunit D [Mobiluncus sp.]|uniref:exonuclease SbcCD subunit D n=1 Tax=Mobiluncus sp. TaxID=47293 RepID=UPI002A91352E|nr:exonuclease SbcCD subunit D C-terminal domain-containing protein [Mobiluncus sp.]MDY6076416.1 exonuclease SbcCD subunit D C-terminal domain-containing protein [Mobiluncus sp.]
MKFLHTSDWHLGRDFMNYDLAPYQDYFLEQILTQIEAHRPDALLITGDVLDKPNPSDADLDKLSGFLNEARQITRIILIAGNHDGASRLGFAKGFTLPEVNIVTKAAQVGTAIEIPGPDGELGALVYPIPYLSPYQDRAELSTWVDNDGVCHLDDTLKQPASKDDPAPLLPGKPEVLFGAALRRIGRDLDRRNTDVPVLAMAHDYLTQVDPNKEVEPLGNLSPIPVSMLDYFAGGPEGYNGIDYLALGHIHGAYQIRGTKATAWYAGSPLPYRVSESNEKCTLLVEVHPDHQVEVEKLPLIVPYKVTRLQGSIEDLTNPDDSRYQSWHQAFCSINLTETTLPPNAYNRLKAVFPRMLKLTHSQGTLNGTLQSGAEFRELSELEIATEFLRTCGIDEEEDLALLTEIYEDAVGGTEK